MLHVPHIKKKIYILLLIFSCQFEKYCWTAITPILKKKHFMESKAKSEPAFVTEVLVILMRAIPLVGR